MLHFTDRGNGQALVLLHGFCEDHRIWDSFIADFPADLRVICIDLPGFGQSEPGQEDLAAWAQYCLDTLKAAGVQQFALCGHSLGGYVSLAMLQKAPERITHYISLHSTADADTSERAQNRLRQVRFLNNYPVKNYIDQIVPALFKPGTSLELVERATKIAVAQSKDGLCSALRSMLQRPDRNAMLKSINNPVLYISGKYDDLLPLENQQRQIAACMKGTHLILENSGHMGMLEEPEICRTEILEFIR